MKFIAKEYEIDAIQYTGANFATVREFFGGIAMIEDRIYKTIEIRIYEPNSDLDIFKTVELKTGDWAFRGLGGEIVRMSDKEFKLTFDELREL